MAIETQEVQLLLFSETGQPEAWRVDAYVFGEWAAHPSPNIERYMRDMGLFWQVSHIPTRAVAFAAPNRIRAVRAAMALSRLERPNAKASVDEWGKMSVSRLDPEWVRISNDAVKDIGVLAMCGGALKEPSTVYDAFVAYLESIAA